MLLSNHAISYDCEFDDTKRVCIGTQMNWSLTLTSAAFI